MRRGWCNDGIEPLVRASAHAPASSTGDRRPTRRWRARTAVAWFWMQGMDQAGQFEGAALGYSTQAVEFTGSQCEVSASQNMYLNKFPELFENIVSSKGQGKLDQIQCRFE